MKNLVDFSFAFAEVALQAAQLPSGTAFRGTGRGGTGRGAVFTSRETWRVGPGRSRLWITRPSHLLEQF